MIEPALDNSASGQLQLSQPLYTGGRVLAAVDAAQADVYAGREDVCQFEATTLQTAIHAYADVRQALEVIDVRQDNLRVLLGELQQANGKYQLGQGTKIDVAQAEAQVAGARSLLAAAQGQLRAVRATYLAALGRPLGELAVEPALPGVPSTLKLALQAAHEESPLLREAAYQERAAKLRVGEARAATRPTINANVTFGAVGAASPFAAERFDRTLFAGLTVSQQIYSGGVVSSQIRQAVDRHTAAKDGVELAGRTLDQNVALAWGALETAAAQVDHSDKQVDASRQASEGLREENRLGLATTLDLLIQEQQFRDAELALIQARHDLFLSRVNLLAAIGRLEAGRLVPGAGASRAPTPGPADLLPSLLEAIPKMADGLIFPPRP